MSAFDTDIDVTVEELLVAANVPTDAAAGKTGAWRSERPVIDFEVCIECGQCFTFCPDNVIDLDLDIDMEYCKGCGVCANVCPVDAIEMVTERSV